MKRILTITLASVAMFAITQQVKAQNPGDLDSSFAIGGYLTTDPVALTGEFYYEMATRPDDKILIGGYTDNGAGKDILLMQFLPDGGIDSSFGSNGIVQMDASIGGNEIVGAIEILADGKILVAGSIQTLTGNDAYIMRLNADGSTDLSFGTSGGAMTKFNSGSNTFAIASDIEVLADNSILVGATLATAVSYDMAVFKFTQGGGLNLGFGIGGSRVVDVAGDEDGVHSIDVMADGRIIVGGYATNATKKATVLLLSSGGTPDNSFNMNGIYMFDQGSGDNIFYSVLADNNGKILASGSTGTIPNVDGIVIRLKVTGSIDSSFATNGEQISDIGGADGIYLYSMKLQPNNRILTTGIAFGSGVKAVYALMLEDNGSPVNDFGSGGDVYHTLTITTVSMAGTCLAQQSDGSLLIGGHLTSPDFIGENLFMIRLHNHSYVGLEQQVVQPILVYPNPATEFFTIHIPENELAERVEFYNTNGQLLQWWKSGSNTYHIPEHIPSGNYILRVHTNHSVYSSGIVIRK